MIAIRPIQEADAPAFREALDAVCRERKYLARTEAPPAERVRAFVSENVREGNPQFVALDEAKVVGWCDVSVERERFGRSHVGILGMGVIASHRGQKIGLRLIEATIAASRAAGLKKIELTVYASNKAALALYQKLGFETEGLRKQSLLVDGVYDDFVVMGLILSA